MRPRLLTITNRVQSLLLGSLLLGTTLAFGGAVWWARPAIAVLTFLFVLAALVRIALGGSMPVLKSPLTFLGVLGLVLAVAQLAPLPGRIAERLSPRSYEVYSRGVLLGRALAHDTTLEAPPSMGIRAPSSLDRPATIRWLVGAAACLALFWGVSQFADRVGHLYLVWGCVVAAFFVNSSFAVVQLVSQSSGLYGFIQPGAGPAWAPSVNDLLATPTAVSLRAVGESSPGLPLAATPVPERPFLLGSLMGGPDGYLALGSIGLPLSLALLLQLIAPRGSREGLWARLGHSGHGGLVVLLMLMTLASGFLTGVMAGLWLSVPFAVAIALVGVPGAWSSGLRWLSLGLTLSCILVLGLGAAAGSFGLTSPGVSAVGLAEAARVWTDAWAIVRDYPTLGTGLGSFASVYPFYKTLDASQTTALSSVLQWIVESGLAGVLILVLGLAWCLFRLPGAVRRVGPADRSLAFGLIGAVVGFSLYSVVHWTVELTAVALAASAVGGTWNRWLAGGTDLFVECT